MANEKTREHARAVITTISEETNQEVIKNYEIPTLYDLETAQETGFAVVLTVSTKYDYTSDVLKMWQERFHADDYMIRVRRNQLRLRFNVRFGTNQRIEL